MAEKLSDFAVNKRVKLAGLWTALILLYVYCDIYSFHRTGYLDEMLAGKIGPFDVSQGLLAAFGLLMLIPALMIPACLWLKAGAAKWANIALGALYTLVNIGNLVGETWAYYWIYGILELTITIVIVIAASNWTKEATGND